MAVNRYDTPAQAQFINTYVPIPFEQLYTLGKQAKENVDKALSEYSTALDKWSDFRSPSAADTQAWYNETVGRAMPVIEEMSKNIDMIKSAEGRSKLYSVINNTDRAKLSMLKQSAEGLTQRQKVNQQLMLSGKYNPLWHDVDFGNYDTTQSGIYNDVAPLAYSSIKDLTDNYVNNLQDTFLGRKGGYNYFGVRENQIRDILNANKSGILSTPQAQKHMQIYIQQHPGSTLEDAANAFMEQAITDNREYLREKPVADPFALESIRQAGQNYRAGMTKGKKGQQANAAPSVYDQMIQDAARNDQRLLENVDIFRRVKGMDQLAGKFEEKRQEALSELEVYKDALANGEITQKQYDKAVESYSKDFELSTRSMAEPYKNAYQDDVSEIFTNQFGLRPNAQNQLKDPIAYNGSANRTLSLLMQPTSSDELNTYNTYKFGKPLLINDNDVPMEAYKINTTNGFVPASAYVNRLTNTITEPVYIKDNSGKNRDFFKDLENGVIKNVLAVPTNTVMAQRDFSVEGKAPKLVQRFTLKIPVESLIQAGYDESEIKDFFKDNFGDSGTTNINVKGISTDAAEDMYGSDLRGRWLGPEYSRITNTGTGTYYTIDVVNDIRPDDVNRVNWEQVRDKNRAGSAFAKENFEQRVADTYDPYFDNNSDI